MATNVFRHTLSTGLVLASAGAIALTPVTVTPQVHPALDTPRVVSASVMPAGLVQDLQLIGTGARSAIEQSVDALTRKVPDLWWTVHEQWPDADLLHWNYALVSDIFLAPITPLLIGPFNDAVAEAVARNFPILGDEIRRIPDFVEYAFVRLIGPVLSAIGGAGVAHSEIFYSMTTLRIEPFIEAIVRAPFHVIDGLLFGGYGDLGPILPGREGQYLPAPGLLTPWGQPPRVRDIKTPDDIVTTTVPDADATMVSLSTGRGEGMTETDTSVTTPATETSFETTEPVEAEAPAAADDATETALKPTESADAAVPVADDDEAAGAGAETEAEAVTEDTKDTKDTARSRPAKVDPAAGIRQGIKDFRAGVRHTVKKLTGQKPSSRSESTPRAESGPDSGGSATSGRSGSE